MAVSDLSLSSQQSTLSEDRLAETKKKQLRVWDDRALKITLAASVILNMVLAFTIHSLRASVSTIGKPLTAVTGVRVSPLNVSDLQGHPNTIRFAGSKEPTVVYYFRPGCHWCARNLSNIKTLADARGREFRFIGISPNDGSLQEYVTKSGIEFPVYAVSSKTRIDAIKLVGATPQTVVISPNGEIIKNWLGAFSDNQARDVEAYFRVNLPGLLPDTSR